MISRVSLEKVKLETELGSRKAELMVSPADVAPIIKKSKRVKAEDSNSDDTSSESSIVEERAQKMNQAFRTILEVRGINSV